MAAAGTEQDPAVGQVDRFDVVIRPVRQLPQIGFVGFDFVQVIGLRSATAIRKQDLGAVAVDIRIADTAERVIKQDLQLARS